MSRYPKVSLPVDEMLELIEAHDSWAGSMHPDDHDEYLSRFAKVKARAERLLEQHHKDK